MDDSVLVFGKLTDEDTDLVVDDRITDLTPAQTAMLDGIVEQLRDTHYREIQALRKRGEILAGAKAEIGRGNFLSWIAECRAKYAASRGTEGFVYSEKTVENYINLHLLYMQQTEVYQRYRHLPAWIVYQVASYALNGKDPETVPALIAASNSTQPLLDDGVGGVSACPIDESYSAIIEMCQDGNISDREAQRIVDNCSSGIAPRIVTLVQTFGVRDSHVLGCLIDINSSMQAAQREGVPFSDIFHELEMTGGYVTLETGDQAPLNDLSSRELWGAYRKHRKEESASESASRLKSLFDELIDHDTAMSIAVDLEDDALVESVTGDDADTTYKITLKKPIEG